MKKLTTLTMLLALLVLGSALQARTIYVTRHGQVGDRKYIHKTARETMITPLGRQQANQLADYLIKKRNFNGTVIVSPLFRTIETGIEVAGKLNKKVILEPGIQEIAPGKKPSRHMKLKQINDIFPGKTIPGKTFNDNWRLCNETAKMRHVRVAKALDRIIAETKGDILLVSHGGTIGSINNALRSKRIKGIKIGSGNAWNCALYIYELNDKNQVTAISYTTEYMTDDQLTSNFRPPKVPKPNDPRYEVAKPKKAKKAAKAKK